MTLKITLLVLALSLAPAIHYAESPPPPNRSQGNGPRRGSVDQWMKRLEKQNPEEHQRLMSLRETDPQAFHAELRSRVEKRRQQMKGRREKDGEHAEEIQTLERDLREKLQALRSESSEEALSPPQIRELRQHLGTLFDLKQDADRKQFEALEHRLEKMKTLFEKREQNRDLIIDQQLQRLLWDHPQEKEPRKQPPR